MLRYSVADFKSTGSTTSSGHQGAKIPFTVDSETGDIIGEADILAGIYRFNVSVTDGKFVTKTPVTVDVSSFRKFFIFQNLPSNLFFVLFTFVSS